MSKNFGQGIPLSTGFDIAAKKPLDHRTVVTAYADLANIPDIQKYSGLSVYVENDNAYYIWDGSAWIDNPNTYKLYDGVPPTDFGSVSDICIDTTSGDVYRKERNADSNTVSWIYKMNITGPKGDKGDKGSSGTRGSIWTIGVAISGEETNKIFPDSGLTLSMLNDIYLNAENGNYYVCIEAGNADIAKWSYIGTLKGVNGESGISPTIGPNGNWFIGETDTGVQAKVDETAFNNALAKKADYVESKASITRTISSFDDARCNRDPIHGNYGNFYPKGQYNYYQLDRFSENSSLLNFRVSPKNIYGSNEIIEACADKKLNLILSKYPINALGNTMVSTSPSIEITTIENEGNYIHTINKVDDSTESLVYIKLADIFSGVGIVGDYNKLYVPTNLDGYNIDIYLYNTETGKKVSVGKLPLDKSNVLDLFPLRTSDTYDTIYNAIAFDCGPMESGSSFMLVANLLSSSYWDEDYTIEYNYIIDESKLSLLESNNFCKKVTIELPSSLLRIPINIDNNSYSADTLTCINKEWGIKSYVRGLTLDDFAIYDDTFDAMFDPKDGLQAKNLEIEDYSYPICNYDDVDVGYGAGTIGIRLNGKTKEEFAALYPDLTIYYNSANPVWIPLDESQQTIINNFKLDLYEEYYDRRADFSIKYVYLLSTDSNGMLPMSDLTDIHDYTNIFNLIPSIEYEIDILSSNHKYRVINVTDLNMSLPKEDLYIKVNSETMDLLPNDYNTLIHAMYNDVFFNTITNEKYYCAYSIPGYMTLFDKVYESNENTSDVLNNISTALSSTSDDLDIRTPIYNIFNLKNVIEGTNITDLYIRASTRYDSYITPNTINSPSKYTLYISNAPFSILKSELLKTGSDLTITNNSNYYTVSSTSTEVKDGNFVFIPFADDIAENFIDYDSSYISFSISYKSTKNIDVYLTGGSNILLSTLPSTNGELQEITFNKNIESSYANGLSILLFDCNELLENDSFSIETTSEPAVGTYMKVYLGFGTDIASSYTSQFPSEITDATYFNDNQNIKKLDITLPKKLISNKSLYVGDDTEYNYLKISNGKIVINILCEELNIDDFIYCDGKLIKNFGNETIDRYSVKTNYSDISRLIKSDSNSIEINISSFTSLNEFRNTYPYLKIIYKRNEPIEIAISDPDTINDFNQFTLPKPKDNYGLYLAITNDVKTCAIPKSSYDYDYTKIGYPKNENLCDYNYAMVNGKKCYFANKDVLENMFFDYGHYSTYTLEAVPVIKYDTDPAVVKGIHTLLNATKNDILISTDDGKVFTCYGTEYGYKIHWKFVMQLSTDDMTRLATSTASLTPILSSNYKNYIEIQCDKDRNKLIYELVNVSDGNSSLLNLNVQANNTSEFINKVEYLDIISSKAPFNILDADSSFVSPQPSTDITISNTYKDDDKMFSITTITKTSTSKNFVLACIKTSNGIKINNINIIYIDQILVHSVKDSVSFAIYLYSSDINMYYRLDRFTLTEKDTNTNTFSVDNYQKYTNDIPNELEFDCIAFECGNLDNEDYIVVNNACATIGTFDRHIFDFKLENLFGDCVLPTVKNAIKYSKSIYSSSPFDDLFEKISIRVDLKRLGKSNSSYERLIRQDGVWGVKSYIRELTIDDFTQKGNNVVYEELDAKGNPIMFAGNKYDGAECMTNYEILKVDYFSEYAIEFHNTTKEELFKYDNLKIYYEVSPGKEYFKPLGVEEQIRLNNFKLKSFNMEDVNSSYLFCIDNNNELLEIHSDLNDYPFNYDFGIEYEMSTKIASNARSGLILGSYLSLERSNDSKSIVLTDSVGNEVNESGDSFYELITAGINTTYINMINGEVWTCEESIPYYSSRWRYRCTIKDITPSWYSNIINNNTYLNTYYVAGNNDESPYSYELMHKLPFTQSIQPSKLSIYSNEYELKNNNGVYDNVYPNLLMMCATNKYPMTVLKQGFHSLSSTLTINEDGSSGEDNYVQISSSSTAINNENKFYIEITPDTTYSILKNGIGFNSSYTFAITYKSDVPINVLLYYKTDPSDTYSTESIHTLQPTGLSDYKSISVNFNLSQNRSYERLGFDCSNLLNTNQFYILKDNSIYVNYIPCVYMGPNTIEYGINKGIVFYKNRFNVSSNDLLDTNNIHVLDLGIAENMLTNYRGYFGENAPVDYIEFRNGLIGIVKYTEYLSIDDFTYINGTFSIDVQYEINDAYVSNNYLDNDIRLSTEVTVGWDGTIIEFSSIGMTENAFIERYPNLKIVFIRKEPLWLPFGNITQEEFKKFKLFDGTTYLYTSLSYTDSFIAPKNIKYIDQRSFIDYHINNIKAITQDNTNIFMTGTYLSLDNPDIYSSSDVYYIDNDRGSSLEFNSEKYRLINVQLGTKYLNINTGDVFECIDVINDKSSSWELLSSLKSLGIRGSIWNNGTAITGTSITPTSYATGISNSLVNDMYLNTSTGNVYKCTTAGDASTAKWIYTGSIKGATGPKGDTGAAGTRGSKWYSGGIVTGTSTSGTIFPNSGITSALLDDMYLNTYTGNTYKCTLAGNASVAKWTYVGSIKGATGEIGPQGPKGDTGAAGAKGETGAQGPQGIQGVKGDKGDTGAAGTRGSKWYSGTAITGSSTTGTIFASSGITSALIDDMYLNTTTGYTYKCTLAGNASVAKWTYVGSIKGATGAKGETGAAGTNGTTPTIGSNGNWYIGSTDTGVSAKIKVVSKQITLTTSNWTADATNADMYNQTITINKSEYTLTSKTDINVSPSPEYNNVKAIADYFIIASSENVTNNTITFTSYNGKPSLSVLFNIRMQETV